MKNLFHYTRKNYEAIVLERHNHKYKLSKGKNGLFKFVNADVELYFFEWLVGLFEWEHNLKTDQNSMLRSLFVF